MRSHPNHDPSRACKNTGMEYAQAKSVAGDLRPYILHYEQLDFF